MPLSQHPSGFRLFESATDLIDTASLGMAGIAKLVSYLFLYGTDDVGLRQEHRIIKLLGDLTEDQLNTLNQRAEFRRDSPVHYHWGTGGSCLESRNADNKLARHNEWNDDVWNFDTCSNLCASSTYDIDDERMIGCGTIRQLREVMERAITNEDVKSRCPSDQATDDEDVDMKTFVM